MHLRAGNPLSRFFLVYLDGRDVTNVCWEASEKAGYAVLYETDASGKKVIRDNAVRITQLGAVVFRLRPFRECIRRLGHLVSGRYGILSWRRMLRDLKNANRS